MNIVDLLQIKYPKELAIGSIVVCLTNDDNTYIITKWDVPGVPQPTIEELENEIPQYEKEFNSNNFKITVDSLVKDLLNSTAKEKGYDNTLSIASYVSSVNQIWRAEAETFISWRDQIYNLVFAKYNEIDSGADIPLADTFVSSLPKIIWPGE